MRSNDEIIDIINSLREQQNLSISELARRVGMAKSALSRYFNKTREFPLNRVEEFANVLNTSSEYILGFDEDNKLIDKTVSILKQLEEPRQEKVYNYAEEQLHEQESEKVVSIDKKNFAFETIAAHATEDGKMASEEEIISYAQKIIDAHKKKMEKNN